MNESILPFLDWECCTIAVCDSFVNVSGDRAGARLSTPYNSKTQVLSADSYLDGTGKCEGGIAILRCALRFVKVPSFAGVLPKDGPIQMLTGEDLSLKLVRMGNGTAKSAPQSMT